MKSQTHSSSRKSTSTFGYRGNPTLQFPIRPRHPTRREPPPRGYLTGVANTYRSVVAAENHSTNQFQPVNEPRPPCASPRVQTTRSPQHVTVGSRKQLRYLSL